MQASAPGKYEYELEAEATYWMFKHGFQAAAYPAIVGSGPMGNQWHYEDNGRQMKAGELVVMDYAGSLDYLTMDITRTWPVSGRFTDAQLRAYECVLEAQKAIIAAIKPGVAEASFRRSPRTSSRSTASIRAMPTSDITSACRCTTSATGTCPSKRGW